MERSVIFAGFGGQGLLFAGQILAQAAMDEGREVLWIPSYGPEMRGGTASCTVILSEEQVGSPVVERADVAVVLNPPSHAKFAHTVAPNGVIVTNSTLVDARSGRDDVSEIALPLSELAAAAGDPRLVSVVALGVVAARTGMVLPTSVHRALVEIVGRKRPAILEADLAAFDAGLRAAGGSSIAEIIRAEVRAAAAAEREPEPVGREA
jgi:2-oxoglutarate ferredoxin oxidoreductase subunit gamma